MASSTLFFVDHDPVLQETLAEIAQAKGLEYQAFRSPQEFLHAYTTNVCGCVVIEVQPQHITATEFLDRLKSAHIDVPVLVVAEGADVPMAVESMRAGAFCFLETPLRTDELSREIDRALESDAVQRCERAAVETLRERMRALSGDELEVMRRMISGQPNKQVAAELDIGLRTVELRRSNVFKKMQAASLAELVQQAVTIGLLPTWSPDDNGTSPKSVPVDREDIRTRA